MTTHDTGAAADKKQSPQRDIEAWKHCADMGATDKTLPSLKAAKTDVSLANVAWHLAGPCDPLTELAPVFRVYWYLALGAATIHAGFFAWAWAVVLCRG